LRPWKVKDFLKDETYVARSFDGLNNFRQKQDGPIKEATHVVLDADSGQVRASHGANRFYMPHGLSLDPSDNVWLTDVAMHQVIARILSRSLKRSHTYFFNL